ncbi:rod-binding protein [Photobacterium sp. TY1-4]|uniref:rod-binding protein n=1 Tax=Photobacterium sp. TY1-4 TaxID=2899122 RepID=UPI0021BEEC98|nr:rod-binding protein [Photobacterium sp. TY1-4]UXI03097.1 rod-binding protein [Photobacterium sp. TY1-4]
MKLDAKADQPYQSAMLYHDNSALAGIRHSSDKQQALETVAGQFEAMFLQMVLRQMRSSSDVLAADDNPFSSKEQGVYRDFYDGQLAIELAKNQRSGIADMLIKQLGPKSQQVLAQAVESANEPQAAVVAGKTAPPAAQAPGAVQAPVADLVNTAAADTRPNAAVSDEAVVKNDIRLNESTPVVAMESPEELRMRIQTTLSQVAFQQPLIRRMER